MKVKQLKEQKGEKMKNTTRRNIFAEISCFSHCFAETIVINPRRIFKKWRRFMFLRGPSTKASLNFITAIMVLEILNNVGKHSLQKILVKSSFCREYCGQSEIHHKKMKNFFVPKRPIYKNLSHFFHSDFRTRDKCTSLQAIFQTL